MIYFIEKYLIPKIEVILSNFEQTYIENLKIKTHDNFQKNS